MKHCVYPAREEILRRAGELVEGEEGEFLKDLLLGERTGISEETREAFLESGVAHVLAVSGYRVLVVAGMLAFALTFFRIPRFIHPLIALPALLFYAALAGAHPPVVRASVMAMVFMTGKCLERMPNSKNALGVAALIVLGGIPASFSMRDSSSRSGPCSHSYSSCPSSDGLSPPRASGRTLSAVGWSNRPPSASLSHSGRFRSPPPASGAFLLSVS